MSSEVAMTYPITEASAQHVIERTTFRTYDGPPHHGKSFVVHMTALLDSSMQSVCNGTGTTPQEADVALRVALLRVHQAQRDAIAKTLP